MAVNGFVGPQLHVIQHIAVQIKIHATRMEDLRIIAAMVVAIVTRLPSRVLQIDVLEQNPLHLDVAAALAIQRSAATGHAHQAARAARALATAAVAVARLAA